MITLYTKSNCKHCQLIKEYLDSINVEYKNVNVDTRIPADLAEQMSKENFPSVFNYPILIDNNNKISFGLNILTDIN